VLGLTATPIRRDGQQPIIFMQCGPIRYTAAKPAGAPHDLEVLPRSRHARIELPTDAGIQDVFRHLAKDQARTEAIAAEVREAVKQGRKVLVLTERTEHLGAIKAELDGLQPTPFVLHGRMSKKQRAVRLWWKIWMHCRPTHRASSCQPASWLARASITRRSTC